MGQEKWWFRQWRRNCTIFYHFVNKNIFRKVDGETNETVRFKEATDLLSDFSPILKDLINEKLYHDLIHGGLEFQHDFSYDVVPVTQFVFNDHFSHLSVTFMGPVDTNGKNVKPSLPVVTYKFLAGFDRRNTKSPFPVNTDEALRFTICRSADGSLGNDERN